MTALSLYQQKAEICTCINDVLLCVHTLRSLGDLFVEVESLCYVGSVVLDYTGLLLGKLDALYDRINALEPEQPV